MQREMELRGAGYVFIFVTLLCALAIASSEGRRKTIEMVLFSADDCRLTSSELGAHMVMHFLFIILFDSAFSGYI